MLETDAIVWYTLTQALPLRGVFRAGEFLSLDLKAICAESGTVHEQNDMAWHSRV